MGRLGAGALEPPKSEALAMRLRAINRVCAGVPDDIRRPAQAAIWT